MSIRYAAIIGGTAGVLALVAVFVAVSWYCYRKCKNSSNKNSETGSSDPSALVEWNRGGGSSSVHGPQTLRQFTIEELEQATRQFSEANLIGYGSFGPVYKGLLHDTIVAIKRRPGPPREDFVAEVTYLSDIRHRNLVTLFGYCQESGSQMLVYEYVPNGSVRNHLYDKGAALSTTLEFKQRLSIGIGAAKGLCHLHSLNPPLVHKNFKTANVLVDENFIVKVSDAGVFRLLEKIEEAGPSQPTGANVFLDPEVGESRALDQASDVYSFGVFLLELITGQEAVNIEALGSSERLIQWVRESLGFLVSHCQNWTKMAAFCIEKVIARLSSDEFVDQRLVGSFTTDGMKDLIRLTLKCLSFPRQGRPKMEAIVLELERVREKEIELTTVMGEGTSTIIKGSELFA